MFRGRDFFRGFVKEVFEIDYTKARALVGGTGSDYDDRENWHTDVTFVDRPPAFTLLHAVVIPPVGGDTLWASTVSASCWGSPRRRRDLIRVLQDYIIRPEQTVR